MTTETGDRQSARGGPMPRFSDPRTRAVWEAIEDPGREVVAPPGFTERVMGRVREEAASDAPAGWRDLWSGATPRSARWSAVGALVLGLAVGLGGSLGLGADGRSPLPDPQAATRQGGAATPRPAATVGAQAGQTAKGSAGEIAGSSLLAPRPSSEGGEPAQDAESNVAFEVEASTLAFESGWGEDYFSALENEL